VKNEEYVSALRIDQETQADKNFIHRAYDVLNQLKFPSTMYAGSPHYLIPSACRLQVLDLIDTWNEQHGLSLSGAFTYVPKEELHPGFEIDEEEIYHRRRRA